MSDDGHDEQCEGDRGRRICGCAARSHLTPAAAVPEAEDGREAIYQTAYAAWRAATNATRTTFAEADALRKVVDAVLSAVPARDDERERLAASGLEVEFTKRLGQRDWVRIKRHGIVQVEGFIADDVPAAPLPEGQEG